ncbi:toll/interleukin-1 receptor domain-containing protein [Longimicrobium sp.]|uniref:toll/interleukin-1 receptor domain-containing protein n=1 Tax=Longimicrobium sp. TaxID=2029185 RepID=UPI002E378671|nr:toll/interleukin-1 receptor domain-containing protein [Longimicrobium sp.]HEX6040830.1 toll/interleukin-1 receptor domain-containing protein [Longimicrobium sp.]
MPGSIFISYRRDDSAYAAAMVHLHLSQRLGKDRVFLDERSIPGGVNFVEHITRSIADCALVLAMIGPGWGGRLRNDGDYVRLELATALRLGIPVLPVFVGGMDRVPAEQLPPELAPLVHQNGIRLRADQGLAEDLRRVDDAVEHARNAPAVLVAQGVEAYVAGRLDEAGALFRNAANQGDPWGQFNLGVCHATGNGAPQNFGTAFQLYRSAANGGCMPAQRALAELYDQGLGTDRDVKEAERWYRAAAAQGDTAAAAVLERFDAAHVPEGLDGEALFKRGEQALEQGYYDAALSLLEQAGTAGYPAAYAVMGLIYTNPRLQVGSAAHQWLARRDRYQKAAACFRLASRHGVLPEEGYLHLAYALDFGRAANEGERNEMVDAYRRAANAGAVGALQRLGELYLEGDIVRRDLSEAARWFQAAGERGDSRSREMLAVLYAYGAGVPQDFGEAERWAVLAGMEELASVVRSPFRRLPLKKTGPAGALEYIAELNRRRRADL